MAWFELPTKPQIFGNFFFVSWYSLAEIFTWFYYCSSRTEVSCHMETDWCLNTGALNLVSCLPARWPSSQLVQWTHPQVHLRCSFLSPEGKFASVQSLQQFYLQYHQVYVSYSAVGQICQTMKSNDQWLRESCMATCSQGHSKNVLLTGSKSKGHGLLDAVSAGDKVCLE